MDGMAETYESMLKQITHYSPLFELATKCLFLPYYFDVFNDEAIDENHETNLKSQKQRKSVFKKDNIVPNEYIIRERTVWRLDRNTKSKGNTVYFGDNDFKLERDGFWKNLDYNSMGKDKSGHPIQGRTWVERTQAWYEKDKQTLTVNLKNQIIPSGSNLAIGNFSTGGGGIGLHLLKSSCTITRATRSARTAPGPPRRRRRSPSPRSSRSSS